MRTTTGDNSVLEAVRLDGSGVPDLMWIQNGLRHRMGQTGTKKWSPDLRVGLCRHCTLVPSSTLPVRRGIEGYGADGEVWCHKPKPQPAMAPSWPDLRP